MTDTEVLRGFLTREELAAALKCTPRTVARYETLPDGLPSYFVSGRRLYRLEQVKAWLETRLRRPNPTGRRKPKVA